MMCIAAVPFGAKRSSTVPAPMLSSLDAYSAGGGSKSAPSRLARSTRLGASREPPKVSMSVQGAAVP